MYSNDDILSDIKKQGIIPSDGNTISDEDILRYAHDALISYIYPLVMSYTKDYFVNFIDIPIVPGKDKYDIPYRSYAFKVRELTRLNNGNEEDIPIMTISDKAKMAKWGNTQSSKYSFFFQANSIRLYPMPKDGGDSIRMFFFFRPSKLVGSIRGGKIVSIDRNLNKIEVAIAPSNLNSGKLDLVKSTPGFDVLDWDLEPTSISGTEFTFSEPLPEDLVLGDYLCSAEESVFPLYTPELKTLLIQAVICKILSSITHTEAFKIAQNELEKMEKGLPKMLGDRAQGSKLPLRVYGTYLDYTKRS